MEAVRRVERCRVDARIAHQVDDRDTLLCVDRICRHPHRGALRRLFLGQRRSGQVGERRQVRQVEDDDAGLRRAGADAVHQGREVGAERRHLVVDVGRLVAAAGAAAERSGDRVHVVGPGKYRDERRIATHERHFLLDDVAADDAAVVRAQILEGAADHRGRNTQVADAHRVAAGFQLACGHPDVASPVTVLEDEARARRADAHDIACANCRVDQRRPGRRRATR